jgi:L-serine dehydratase
MESIQELFKIGYGPSSSHTMGPQKAAEIFLKRNPIATSFVVTLYGSLAFTGKGHLTDYVIKKTLGENRTQVDFNLQMVYHYHPNGMLFEAFKEDKKIDSWLVFSVGGGSLKELDEPRDEENSSTYPYHQLTSILDYCRKEKINLADYVSRFEDSSINDYLEKVLTSMEKTMQKGLLTGGELPGTLHVQRKASHFYSTYLKNPSLDNLVFAYSLATAEENASAGIVVTAPTCGSCGVVPAVLFALSKQKNISRTKQIEALKVAGLIGNLAKCNASISGAEVGCQGEIGVACSMAAAMATYLQDGDNDCMEYAAEIALEHHLGMTCDPVDGLVQIPCIERNAIASLDAINASEYARIAGGKHNVTFDSVLLVMKNTGKDLADKYKETSKGGLALKYIGKE